MFEYADGDVDGESWKMKLDLAWMLKSVFEWLPDLNCPSWTAEWCNFVRLFRNNTYKSTRFSGSSHVTNYAK